MSDAWRIKSYYRPRILISTQAVLDSEIPDAIVCLTGGQINLLRALLEYGDRLSTFVSEYHANYYLCPTDEEWEELRHIVAQTSEDLVGCNQIESLLEDLLECCRNTQADAWPAGGILEGQRDYDDYQSPVEYEVGDPPEGFEDWSDWTQYKCCAAQMIIDDMVDLGERLEVWYSAGAGITFAVFQTMVLGTAVAPPVALVMAIISVLAVAGTALAMIAFQNWLQTNKQDLVCIIHLSTTVEQAHAGILEYIDDKWDLALGKAFGEYLFSWDVLSKAYDGGLDVDSYSAGYCDPCTIIEGDGWFAVALNPSVHTYEMEWVDAPDTVEFCLDKLTTNVCAGIMWELVSLPTAALQAREPDVCPNDQWEDTHTTIQTPGWQYSGNGSVISSANVIATLHPTATYKYTGVNRVPAAAAYTGGMWRCNGGPGVYTMRLHYMVYEGSPPG